MFQGFVEWLEATPLNAVLADTTNFWTWLIIPVSQCIHILAVATVMMAMGIMNLRLLGIAGTAQSFGQLTRHLMPWAWTALIILFLTGTLQTLAEPGRELLNVGFRTKMVLVLTSVILLMIYESTGKKDPNYWEQSAKRRKLSYILASTSLVLWIGITVAGRLIAYLDTRVQ